MIMTNKDRATLAARALWCYQSWMQVDPNSGRRTAFSDKEKIELSRRLITNLLHLADTALRDQSEVMDFLVDAFGDYSKELEAEGRFNAT